MTNEDLPDTLKKLKQYEGFVPGIGRLPSRLLADNYKEFVNVFYRDLDQILATIEENPEVRAKDGEDRLTIEIRNMLRILGYDASHDSKIGGHADLLVRKGEFIWLGEAKVHKQTYDYIWEGFQQLCTRYSIGSDNQSCGGLIIYIRIPNSTSVMERWKSHLEGKKLPEYKMLPCGLKSIAFFSTHSHERSGLPFEVRHIPVMLYFNPQDKSGRNRKNQ